MEEIQQSNAFFMIPVTVAYLSVCLLWFLLNARSNRWPVDQIKKPEKPLVEFLYALLAAVAVIAVGQLYSAGFLLPSVGNRIIDGLMWVINNFIIYSPIFITLFLRKQSLPTIFISSKDQGIKWGFGIVGALVSVFMFLVLRGELVRFPQILTEAVSFKTLTYFPALFFENMAIAFLFVRLKWLAGIKWAILIPSILFALAHVPRSLAEGDSIMTIITFFFLTGTINSFVLYTVSRTRDILWLGVVHYLMDIAIKSF